MSDEAPKKRYWMGDAPTQCDLNLHHSHAITTAFVDGKTKMGPWGNMCLTCHRRVGVGLGTGKGQKYEKQDDGKWLKVAG